MIYSSLAVLALSASAIVNPLTSRIHLHPKVTQSDTRVSIELHNSAMTFRDVKIGDHIYTVKARQSLDIKAPIGTVIYADSRMLNFHRGDAIVEVTPTLENQKITID